MTLYYQGIQWMVSILSVYIREYVRVSIFYQSYFHVIFRLASTSMSYDKKNS